MRLTVKLGGSILEEGAVRRQILRQVAELRGAGHETILVHGGGKSLSRRLEQLQLPSRFVDGLRVTDEATLRVALMVLAGEVNKAIVAELEELGTTALGLCGADAGAVRCVPISREPISSDGLGFVGRPTSVNRELFELLLMRGMIPVVSSLALGGDYQLYNINADQMAAACAWGTGSEALVYLTDVPGVRGEDGKVLTVAGRSDIEELRSKNIISGGMLPKTLSCLEAVSRGVSAVYILPGAGPEVLQRLINGNLHEGTCIHEHQKCQ